MPGADGGRDPEHLVLYDGACGFCSRTVQWILAADRDERFHFAPLDGPTATAVLARHPDVPRDLDSVLYVDRSGGTERVLVRSDAILRICRGLPGRGWIAALGALVPHRIADLVYRTVARNRRRISAGLGACPLPPATARARFLA
jgi:predicted DCC family thiol-disulfide oxidoreductase YuxK